MLELEKGQVPRTGLLLFTVWLNALGYRLSTHFVLGKGMLSIPCHLLAIFCSSRLVLSALCLFLLCSLALSCYLTRSVTSIA
eukprot:scaffold89787_cov18-Tisochrysis_lutea.AAC.1